MIITKVNTPIGNTPTGKMQFLDKDTKGKLIDSRAKDSHSVEIEGDSRFCGKRFVLATKLYGDKRCLYCGKWFHWKDTDYQTWVKTKNIDRLNNDDNVEPLHCGSAHCEEYHYLCIKAEESRLERTNPEAYKVYKSMQKQGLVD
jgi:hypothetical protein